MSDNTTPIALITGSAKRIGAECARHLHTAGYNLVLHYRQSAAQVQALVDSFNQQRPHSAVAIAADLNQPEQLQQLAQASLQCWQRLDLLVNNASSFYPTPFGKVTEPQWNDLLNSNLKAPFFLAQALAPALASSNGAIVNIADIYGERPLLHHSVYSIAKAGNIMLTQALAIELAPRVRVNGIAPGAILWPEQQSDTDDAQQKQAALLQKTPLQVRGQAADIARTLVFLAREAPYITGQVIAVDGGRRLCI